MRVLRIMRPVLNHKGLWLFVIVVILCLFYLNVKYCLFAINIFNTNKEGEQQLGILTFNINSVNGDSGSAFINRIINEVNNTGSDVVCFQEISEENLLHLFPVMDSICGYNNQDDLLAFHNRYRIYSHKKILNYKKYSCLGECDTTDFSKQELLELSYLKNEIPFYSADVEISKGKYVRMFSGHLRSSAYTTARRSMDKDASWFDGLSLYWRNYKVGKRIRDYEAENVRRFIDEARAEGCPVIVAGDLNDWCGSDCLETLMGSDLKDAWWEGGNGFGWTYFGWNLRLRLDHILYSEELELVDVEVIDTDISDHKPLVAKFKIK